jgi:hypothetical protein
VFDRIPRRAHRDGQAHIRLDRLTRTAPTDPANRSDDLPADQEWIEEPAAGPGQVPIQDDAAAPPGDPWWRRGRSGRLVERWLPGDAARRRMPVAPLAALVLGVAVAIGAVASSGGG